MTSHPALSSWIADIQTLCRPARLHWCDGSKQEFQALCRDMTTQGTAIPLNPDTRPGSYLFRSDPRDVARIEERTFICSASPDYCGPTNNWRDPHQMKAEMTPLFGGSMRGRTLYVIPFCLGPLDSPFARFGVELSDSPYVAANMHLVTRMGREALKRLELSKDSFARCLHSVGAPLEDGQTDVPWPCDPDKTTIAHFPQTREVWSYGSGYGGNALLGKKCFALRIASIMARQEGWLAEHMLILGLTNPQGRKKYFAAAFPSACGKTNLAMMTPNLPGWKVECVGDDIAWLRRGPDGGLWAVNPEAGFFGVAPGTSQATNPNAMHTIERDTLFTNVAQTPADDVWWEGMTPEKPPHLTSWKGEAWTPDSGEPAAHPNGRFTVKIEASPILDPSWNDAQGVPIEAILLGGRRSTTIPLVYEAFSWQHGVFIGAGMASETTAAARGATGRVRRDPFAMLPFCGYHMGDYFNHWLQFGAQLERAPKFFAVNWFRKGEGGQFLWPGYGDNARVLKWIFERLDGRAEARMSPVGMLPASGAIDVSGMAASVDVDELLRVDAAAWTHEIEELRAHFAQFEPCLPLQITRELSDLEARLNSEWH